MNSEFGNVSILTAFFAGILSFLSPCVLPLIPGYISFITGASLTELQNNEELKKIKSKVILQSLFFVIGFSTVFIAMGASATVIGKFLLKYAHSLSIAAGILIVLFGLHLTGIIKIPFLYYEKRVQTNKKPVNIWGALLVGFAFAFGWTPCIGPILAGILTVAGAQKTIIRGIILLSVYSLGLAIPFMLTAYSLTFFFKIFDKIKKYLNIFEWTAGALLIAIGVLMITGNLTIIASWFSGLSFFAK